MKTLGIIIAALSLTGCATNKVKRAFENGYAQGHRDAQKDLTAIYKQDMDVLSKVNEDLRRRLDDCHWSDKNK